MPEAWISDFEGNIEDLLSVKETDLNSCLIKLSPVKQGKLNLEFYIIRCTVDEVREKDFIERISSLIIQYALNRNEYADRSPGNLLRLVNTAKGRFKKSSGSGEIGELILFALLESQRRAPQILNKMALKTDGNMHYHGLDGIHLGACGDEIRLYYGESKVWADIKPAISDAVKSIEEFHTNLKDRRIEINLVTNYMDASKFNGYVNEVKALLNPYTADKSKFREVYAIFIGFNWNSIEDVDFSTIEKDIEVILKDCILRHSGEIIKKCKSSVESSAIDNQIEFFFIPFKNVEKIREQFMDEIL